MFVRKPVEVGSVMVEVYLSENDIYHFYEKKQNVVDRLVKANIITEDDIRNYLDKGGA